MKEFVESVEHLSYLIVEGSSISEVIEKVDALIKSGRGWSCLGRSYSTYWSYSTYDVVHGNYYQTMERGIQII